MSLQIERVNYRRILRWEMWGILFIVLFGALLHFTFELSGGWLPLGVISAVNESVWEHLKLAFYPSLFFTLIEYFFLFRPGKPISGFLLARALGTLLMPIIIVAIFYSYTSFTRESILSVDLSSFVIAIAAGQFVSYLLLRKLAFPAWADLIGLCIFSAGILLFAIFTFYPPYLGIFQDPESGQYGI